LKSAVPLLTQHYGNAIGYLLLRKHVHDTQMPNQTIFNFCFLLVSVNKC